MMLIAIDIGNSSITIGYFLETGLVVQQIPTHPLTGVDEYRLLLTSSMDEKNIAKSACNGIISSVVPGLTDIFREILEGFSGKGEADILVVNSAMSGIGFRIPAPEELGTDRIANAVAAFSLVKSPVAVVDFGSATTITVIDAQGYYIGGSIMPGIGLMNESLGTKTSKLNMIELREPGSALGRDTTGCILTGLIIGTAGAVERIIEDIEAETRLTFNIILTGGHCMLIDPLVRRPHMMKPDLTLEGLRLLYEKNRPQ